MTKRTTDRFPKADVLAQYLRDFASKQESAGKIRYRTNISAISRQATGTGFVLNVQQSAEPSSCNAEGDDCFSSSSSSSSIIIKCGKVVHAGGNWKPNKPNHLMQKHGFDLALDYSELPSNGYEAFEDKKVAIFGLGNAAMETADALTPYTAFVHAFPGRGQMKFPHFAYETRYVGNVRTWRSEILDSYILKSLDGGFPTFDANTIMVQKCGDGGEKRCLYVYDPDRHTVNLAFQPENKESVSIIDDLKHKGCLRDTITSDVAYGVLRSPVGDGRDAEIQEAAETIDATNSEYKRPENLIHAVPGINHPYAVVDASCITEEVSKRYGKLPGLGGWDPYPLVYDAVVTCFGFLHDMGLYSEDAAPLMQANHRYPILTDTYESVNVPGLFFAGQLAHGRDFKRAAGGFIHGFRYTARALVRMLAEQHVPHSTAWPHLVFGPISSINSETADAENEEPKFGTGLAPLANKLLERINVGSAAYQMVHVLGDGFVLQCDKDMTMVNATYFEEMPLAHFHKRFRGLPRLTASFGYNGQVQSLEKSVKEGTMFRVFLWWYPGDCSRDWSGPSLDSPPGGYKAEPRELLQFRETLSTQYAEDAIRPIVEAFVAARANDLLRPSLPTDEQSRGASEQADGASSSTVVTGRGRTGWLPIGIGVGTGRVPYLDEGNQYDDFPPGLVDLWILNVGNVALQLYYRGPAPLGGEWNKDSVVHPGSGFKLVTQHLDTWRATNDETGGDADFFEVDLSNGIVQDWMAAG